VQAEGAFVIGNLGQVILRTRCLPANEVKSIIEAIATVIKEANTYDEDTIRYVWIGALISAENEQKRKAAALD
jgi:hypothetical protein